MSDTTYIFENEKVYAMREGKVVHSAATLEELEKVAGPLMAQPGIPAPQPPVHPPIPQQGQLVPCPGCGAEVPGQDQVCPHCGTPIGPAGQQPIQDPMMDQQQQAPLPPTAAHVITPGGIKGKVLARTPDLWGETVTVRLENGRIAHLPVSKVASAPEEKTASVKTSAEGLLDRIEATFQEDRASLMARLAELDEIKETAGRLASEGKDADTLYGIALAADVEKKQIKEAIDHLDSQDAQRFQAPAPYSMQVSPNSDFRLTDDGWLDNTVSEMIAEAEGQDFERILDEEPQLMVSDLNDGAIADMGATRDMALAHIRSKTAGLDPELASEIEKDFISRVEGYRRASVVARKEAAARETSEKVARVIDLPDDSLFGL
jgi:hypothetical protein